MNNYLPYYYRPNWTPLSSIAILYVRMPSISKTTCCADRSILSLLSAYQEYLVAFKLMTSQVVQRARPLSMRKCVIGSQRVHIWVFYIKIKVSDHLGLKFWWSLTEGSTVLNASYQKPIYCNLLLDVVLTWVVTQETLFPKKSTGWSLTKTVRLEQLHVPTFKGAQSRFAHFEKFSLNFSNSSFAIRVNLRHPWPSLFLYGLLLSLWCFSILVNYYFQVSFHLKEIL